MSHIRGAAALLTLITGIAAAAMLFWKPAVAHTLVRLTDSDVPVQVAGFESRGDYAQPKSVTDALPGATIIARKYQSMQSGWLDTTIVSGNSRSCIHDPRLCLTGSGWQISNDREESLPGCNVPVHVCDATTQPGPPDIEVTYFYVVDGKVISSPTAIRAALLWNGLIGKEDAPVYFFRFIQPIAQDPVVFSQNRAQLKLFASEFWQSMLPKLAGVSHLSLIVSGAHVL